MGFLREQKTAKNEESILFVLVMTERSERSTQHE